METFCVLFYTFAVKSVHTLTSSLGTFKKPKWLNADISIEEFPKFFPDKSLSDLHDVTDELITVTLTTLLDSFQQLHYKHRHLLQENRLLREGKAVKHPSSHRKVCCLYYSSSGVQACAMMANPYHENEPDCLNRSMIMILTLQNNTFCLFLWNFHNICLP